jgi:hypothetical protein
MKRMSTLLAALSLLAACSGHTPPPACRGDAFPINADVVQ